MSDSTINLFKLFSPKHSIRRAGGWVSTQSTTTGKMLIAVTSVILVAGIAASVAVPFITAVAKAASENIETTSKKRRVKVD